MLRFGIDTVCCYEQGEGLQWKNKYGEVIFIVEPCILIYVDFTHQQKHFFI